MSKVINFEERKRALIYDDEIAYHVNELFRHEKAFTKLSKKKVCLFKASRMKCLAEIIRQDKKLIAVYCGLRDGKYTGFEEACACVDI